MANLYYNAAVDTAWDTLLNWWTDAAFTDPALALPATGDDVYLAAQVDSGPSTTVTLNHIYVADASTGGGSFYVAFSGAIGNATFNDNSYNSGTVAGDATFNDYSVNVFGTVSGDATFNNNSYNYNFGTVSGNAAFFDSSSNSGTVSGDATFNDSSYNSYNATFNDDSANYSTVSGNATFSLTAAVSQIKGGFAGTFNGAVVISGGVSNGLNLSQLLGLPNFIKI